MKIVADKDIFQVEECFSGLGELVLVPGRNITFDHVCDADVLLTRTVTRVNAALVKNSTLRFIGSASSGMDHVDVACLQEQGIHFSHAPGCNADAVVDYVFAALAWLTEKSGGDWLGKTAGVIGAGNVGSRLAQKMLALGMTTRVYDPFLAPSHPLAFCFAGLDEVLMQDIVSLHVPLTLAGSHPTCHLLDKRRLSELGNDAILINAARGEVIDNQGLCEVLARRQDLKAVLDVWEGEPDINPHLAEKVVVATPHIAGYSRNGKQNATRSIYRAFCGYFGLDNDKGHEPDSPGMLVLDQSRNEAELLNTALLQAYPIHQDFLTGRGSNPGAEFDKRRNGYRFRKEFSDYAFYTDSVSVSLGGKLASLGFRAL